MTEWTGLARLTTLPLVAFLACIVLLTVNSLPAQWRESRSAFCAPLAPPARSGEHARSTADPGEGIVFGPPVRTHDTNMVLAFIENTTERVKTFTVKAPYGNGTTVLGIARGAVLDLPPRQRRVAFLSPTEEGSVFTAATQRPLEPWLVAAQAPLPPAAESIHLEVDELLEDAPSTRTPEAASKMTFGPIRPLPNARYSFIVEVTNGDREPHAFTVQAA